MSDTPKAVDSIGDFPITKVHYFYDWPVMFEGPLLGQTRLFMLSHETRGEAWVHIAASPDAETLEAFRENRCDVRTAFQATPCFIIRNLGTEDQSVEAVPELPGNHLPNPGVFLHREID